MFRDYKHLARLFYSGTVFVSFDTETTGLHKEDDYLMEIGAVKFTSSGELSRFDQLIKPPVEISAFVSNLTHITNKMVEEMPEARTALLDFLCFVGGSNTVLLAHNAPFDIGFINTELLRCTLPPLENLCIDTLPLARWAYPMLNSGESGGNYKLQALASKFGIKAIAAHRADDDARVLMEVFKRIVKDTMPVQKDYSRFSPTDELSPKGEQLELF